MTQPSLAKSPSRIRRPLVWLAAIAFFFTVTCGHVPFITPFLGNSICLFMNRGYIIPGHSSMFTFEVREMNTGSGEWWMSGEDGSYYYFQAMEHGEKYLAFKKTDVAKCPGFNPDDCSTWCEAYVVRGQTELHWDS